MRRHIFLISMLLSGLSYGASKSGSVMNGAIVVQLCTSQILAYKRMLDERAKVRLAISSYLLAPAAQADHAQMLLASQICNSITILTRFYYRDQGPRYVLEQLLIQPKNISQVGQSTIEWLPGTHTFWLGVNFGKRNMLVYELTAEQAQQDPFAKTITELAGAVNLLACPA